jgi:hypothetical protein
MNEEYPILQLLKEAEEKKEKEEDEDTASEVRFKLIRTPALILGTILGSSAGVLTIPRIIQQVSYPIVGYGNVWDAVVGSYTAGIGLGGALGLEATNYILNLFRPKKKDDADQDDLEKAYERSNRLTYAKAMLFPATYLLGSTLAKTPWELAARKHTDIVDYVGFHAHPGVRFGRQLSGILGGVASTFATNYLLNKLYGVDSLNKPEAKKEKEEEKENNALT